MTRMTQAERAKRRKAIADALRGEKTVREVSRAFGVSPATVRLAAHEHAVPVDGHWRGKNKMASLDLTFAIVMDLWQGETQVGITQRYDVCKSRVSQIVIAAVKAGLLEDEK